MAHILNQNLPKIPAKQEIEELKEMLYQQDDMLRRFISEEREQKYQQNFNLYDRRDTGGYINLEEATELLISIAQPVEEQELKELYDELKDSSRNGINFENMRLIIVKNIRDNDKGVQLERAMGIICEGCLPEGKDNVQGKCHADTFKEMLMNLGQKFSEEMADDVLSMVDTMPDPDFDGETTFDANQLIDILTGK